MVSLEEMEKSVGKKVKIHFYKGKDINTTVEEYVRKETDDEEPMLFIPVNLAINQSEIKSIEILD